MPVTPHPRRTLVATEARVLNLPQEEDSRNANPKREGGMFPRVAVQASAGAVAPGQDRKGEDVLVESRLHMLVQPELEMGESVLWAGQPAPRQFVVQSLPTFIFGAVWTAFTANFIHCWYYRVPERDVSGPYGLWGFHGLAIGLFFVVFAVVGLAALLAPVWRYFAALRTVYAITQKRVIIIEGARSRKVRSFGADQIGNIKRSERRDGTGDLTFAREPGRDDDGDLVVKDVEMLGIPEVREVESLLRTTFKEETA